MKEFQYLDELIRKVQGVMDPNYHEDLIQGLTNDGMWKYYDKHPNCFLRMDDKIFPICGQGGRVCPKMINFSIKIIQTMLSKEGYDSDKLNGLLTKMEKLKSRYDKEVPTPYEAAARKGIETKKLLANLRY